MKAKTIQTHLNACSKEELVQILLDLVKRNPAVEHFLIAKFYPSEPIAEFDDYKAEVRAEFFPSVGLETAAHQSPFGCCNVLKPSHQPEAGDRFYLLLCRNWGGIYCRLRRH